MRFTPTLELSDIGVWTLGQTENDPFVTRLDTTVTTGEVFWLAPRRRVCANML